MTVRVVYAMGDKEPDVIEGAKNWTFSGDTLKIWDDKVADGPMIEIASNYVLSIEQVGVLAASEEGLSDSQEGQGG